MLTEMLNSQTTVAPGAKPPDDAVRRLDRLHKACGDFEAMLVQQMFESMEKTLQEGNVVGGGLSGSVYSGFLSEAIGKKMAETGSLGVAQAIFKDVLKNQPELRRLEEARAHEQKTSAAQPDPTASPRPPHSLVIGASEKTPLEMVKPVKTALEMPLKQDSCQEIKPSGRYHQ